MINNKEKADKKNKIIASWIVFYFKRILISIIIGLAYFFLYEEYFWDWTDSDSIKRIEWFLNKYISFNKFLMLIYISSCIILIFYTLFQRQIKWILKHSKKK